MTEHEPRRPQPEDEPEIDTNETDEEFDDFEDDLDAVLLDDEEAAEAEFREIGPEEYLEKKLESLGLTLEAIAEAVPHFNSLSQGKQLLVLENLQQLTLGRIQEEAQDKYRAGVQESKWRGRLWKGITKHFQVRKLEKATAQELQEGGIEAHKTMLWELTRLTQSMPEVEVQNDGTLAIGYAREFENATPEQQEIVSTFNQVANKFARMPEEWSFSTASKKEQQQYMAAKQTYDEAKNKLLTVRYEQILVGGDERAAEALSMDYVNEAEFAVRMNQFLNTNPDVEKQLQSIKNEKALTKAIKDIFVERTGLLVGGAVVRSFTISTLGWVAAPIVGAGIGAWRGKARAEETLVEREKAARKGVEDTSEEARQFINAENSGYTLTNQINSLMDEIDKNGEKISRKLASLEAVVKFTRDKIDAGHVNYGTQEDRLRNRYNLLREVAYAQAVVCAYSGDSEVASKIMRRMNSTLTSREQKITKAQSAYMKKQMLKGAAYGAGFALAGAGIRHVAGQAAEATGLDEKFGRAMSSVWGNDEATNTEAPAAGSASSEKANTPPPGPLAGEGRAQESPDFVQGKVQEKITGTPDAISLNNTEAAVENESVQEAPAEPEAVETAEITGQQRIEKTATHFGFKPADGQEGALVLNMAEAAEKDPNLGKLEQVLDRLVAAQYVKEFGDKLDPDEAAKILNMAANLRVAFERGDASFMDKWASEGGDKLSQLFNESLEYDAESKTLTIKNQVTFEQLVDGLKEHADELGSAGKLDGAVGELPKIKQDTWRDIVNAAQDKDIEVEDYSKNERVKAAYLANQAKDAPLAADEPAEAEVEAKPSPAEAIIPVEPHIQAQRELPKLLDEIKGINHRTTDPREKAMVGLWEKVFEYSKITDPEKGRVFAEKLFHQLEPFADQYQDVRHMYTAGLEQMLDDEVRKGEGVFHMGSANPEKLEEFSGKLGRMHGLDEQSSDIFVSWLAGEDAVLDRSDFKRLGLWAKENGAVKKNHFDPAVFGAKVREFIGLTHSTELPASGEWEPRTIHYIDDNGARHEDVVNMRTVTTTEGGRTYELDTTGDKQVDKDERTGEFYRYPEGHVQKSARGIEVLQEPAEKAPIAESTLEAVTEGVGAESEGAPEINFLGVSLPAESPELAFSDKYTPLEQANIQEYVNKELSIAQEITHQFTEWKEKYGDRPQFSDFEERVRRATERTAKVITRIIRDTQNSYAPKLSTSVSGSMSAAESAHLHLELMSGATRLRTLEESVADMDSRIESMQTNPPESPVEPQETIPESTPAEAPAVAEPSPESTAEAPEAVANNEALDSFLQENLDPNGEFAKIESIADESEREGALGKLDAGARRDYLRYRIHDVAKDLNDNPDNEALAQKLGEGLEKGGNVLVEEERAALEKLLNKK